MIEEKKFNIYKINYKDERFDDINKLVIADNVSEAIEKFNQYFKDQSNWFDNKYVEVTGVSLDQHIAVLM